MQSVKHIILVLSGKGGVGKSTVASQLALTLARKQFKVGILDIDLTGPSIPRMLGVTDKSVLQSDAGMVPVPVNQGTMNLSVMSLGLLLDNPDSAVVWRGPKKSALIKQFLDGVSWGDLDYLIIDTPPGTSDEHITVTENLIPYKPDGAVLVTTPQAVSTADVRREITFCKRVNLPILGIIENMSGHYCPHCSECTNIFSTGGGETLANELQLPFLGRIPIDPNISQSGDAGLSFADKYPASGALKALEAWVDKYTAEHQPEK